MPAPAGDREGAPLDVLTPAVLEATYGAPLDVLVHGGMPVVVDRGGTVPPAAHDHAEPYELTGPVAVPGG